MEDHLENLNKSLNDWPKVTKNTTENAFVKELFHGAVSSSPVVDKFSTWLLAGTGATAGLMIANLDKLLPILTKGGFRIVLVALVISALFGFLAKYKAIFAQSFTLISSEIKKNILPVLEAHTESADQIEEMANQHSLEIQTEIDPSYIFKEFSKAYPAWMKPIISKGFNKGLEDFLSSDRTAANAVFWQGIYTLLQSLCFIGFVILVLLNLNGI